MKKKSKKGLFKSFEPISFTESLSNNIDLRDIDDDLINASHNKKERLFLHRFNTSDLQNLMIKIGLFQHINDIGMHNLILKIDVDESLIHHLRLYFKKESPKNFLLDLRLSEQKFLPDKKFFDNEKNIVTYDMIVIEWLSAQNPNQKFSDHKPQLPGQERPGLGVLQYCFDMMYYVGKEVFKDGYLDIPDHIHGAIMYSKKFKFFNPKHEAILRAILRDLKNYSLVDISWGMITGTIIEEYKKEPQIYDPSEQVFIISDRLKEYFNSKKYKSTFNKYFKRKKYYLKYDDMVQKRDEIMKSKKISDL